MGSSYVLILVVILEVLIPRLSLQQQCSSLSDLGQTECVLLTPHYNTYQWATCLTEDYIMRVSDDRHQCLSSLVTQCWYQCMLEIYEAEEGPVNADCSCGPGEMVPTETDRLPPECYSPGGNDCGWYVDCLERRYPCRGTDDGYAVEYALKFCNLFSHNSRDFSVRGQQWIDEVRQCLQEALVPPLRPWVVGYTCADIRRLGFDSHPGCYTNVSPSICELSCKDVIKAFVIVNYPDGNIKEGSLVTAPVESIQQMFSVMLRCYTHEELSGCINGLWTTIELGVLATARNHPIIGSATGAYFIARHFDEVLSWVKNGFGWFPLFDDDDTDNRKKRQISDEQINIKVLLVDTKLLNISNGTASQSTSEQTLDQAIDNLVNTVMSGSLSMIPLNINNTRVVSSLSIVNQCMDIGCNSTNRTTLVTAPDNSGARHREGRFYAAWLSIATLCLLSLY